MHQDGSRFEGEFRYGAKNGFGVFKFRDGSIYEGNFQHNKIQGKGTYK